MRGDAAAVDLALARYIGDSTAFAAATGVRTPNALSGTAGTATGADTTWHRRSVQSAANGSGRNHAAVSVHRASDRVDEAIAGLMVHRSLRRLAMLRDLDVDAGLWTDLASARQ